MTDPTPLNLDSLSPFESKTRADWRYLVDKGLRGTEFKALTHTTEDGISRGPLTTLNDRPSVPAAIMRGDAPLLAGRDWHISAPVSDRDLDFANTQLLEDLNGGASAARITLKNSKGNRGVPIKRAADFERLFDRVHTDLIPLQFENASPEHGAMLMSLPKLRAAHITFDLAAIPQNCPPNWRGLTIQAAKVHNDGGTEGQELAYMAAAVVHAMRTHGAKTAAQHLSLSIAVDRDAHLTVAKIRAARRIYARIAESFGLRETSIPLHAVSSHRMMQSVDPWSNMLRLMSAGFGAVVGGVDSLTLLPFTEALGDASPFGYRSARNMQLMMMEESHLGQVADVAHGSYFHERMTENLAQAAWAKFQAIEDTGGLEAYMASTQYHADLKIAIEDRNKANAPIVGVTLHKTDSIREPKLRREHK